MKTNLVMAAAICSALVLTSCKSQENAYRQAYERAMAQEQTTTATTTVTTPVQTTTVTTPVVTPEQTTTVVTTTVADDTSDTRTIQGGISVVSGSALKTFSVVVGSFVTQSNAEGLASTLRSKGYDARIIKTNETINGMTGWFRVIASSYSDKASAVQSRDQLRSTYAGAWLLYQK